MYQSRYQKNPVLAQWQIQQKFTLLQQKKKGTTDNTDPPFGANTIHLKSYVLTQFDCFNVFTATQIENHTYQIRIIPNLVSQSLMESVNFAQNEKIVFPTAQENNDVPSCFQNTSLRDRYEQIHNAKKRSLPFSEKKSPQQLQARDELYLTWKAAYEQAVRNREKDPLTVSIQATFKCELNTAYFATYLCALLHISTAFLLYLVFRHLSRGQYHSTQNLIPVMSIIVINLCRPILKDYSQQKLHRIDLKVFKLIFQAIIRKSLKCSVLSNKQISVSRISKLMHVDCQKMMEYPLKHASAFEGALYGILLACMIIYLAKWAGVISFLSLLFLALLRYALKNTIKEKQQQLNQSTEKRIKTTIEVFSMIKFIKTNALESCFFNKLRESRMKQVEKLREKIFYDVLMIMMSVLLRAVALSITMKLITVFEGKFDIAVAFSINLSLGFIHFPNIMKNLANYQDTKASIKEIEVFLNAQEMDSSYLASKPTQDSCAIRIKKGSFEWDTESEDLGQQNALKKKFSLKNINLEIKKGELVALIGTYGSGKTSFVHSLLGEIKNVGESQVVVSGSLAYCCQTPWIMNETVKNNILFGQPFNKRRYQQTLKFSCLEDDLVIFREGDDTIIGEKGSTLSGGQKARISLARALYSNAEIFILDDILSAVDAHVGSFLFNETIKNYLKHKTIVLITHSLNFVQQTDRIYVFQDGRIQLQGSYQQLQNTPILAQVQFTALKSQKQKEQTSTKKNTLQNNNLQKVSTRIEESDQDGFVISTTESLSLYIQRNSGCMFAVIICILTIIIAFVTNFNRLWLNVWSLSSQQSDNFFIFVLVGISVVQSLFILLLSIALYRSKMFILLHNDMAKSVLFAPYSYFQATPFDRIVNVFSNQLNANDKTFTTQIIVMQLQIQFILSFIFGHIYVYHNAGSIWLLLYFFFHFTIMICFYQKYFELNLLSKQLQQSFIIPIKSKYSEVLNGLSTIRAYRKIESMLSDSYKKMERFAKVSTLRCEIESRLKIILSVGSNLYGFLILAVVFFMTDAIGALGVFLIFNTFSFEDAIMRFHKSFNQIAARLKSFARCEQMTRIQPQKGYAKYLSENYIQDSDFKQCHYPTEIFSRGQIIFQNLCFKYDPQQENVLKDMNLLIRPAEKIGIVGRTGSGKSSMMLALLRIIECSAGRILIDNIDISTLNLQQLRCNINIILQDHFLFTGSLRQNVDPSQTHADRQIIESLKLCGIWQKFQQKEGLQTLIAEGGNNLSSGEKQLINISRSLLKPKKIVLIDEATASIDLQTDSLIQKVIRERFADKTVLTIAHRINTVLDSDRILVLGEGRVVEFDTPQNLLKNEVSLFAKLFKESGKSKPNDFRQL